LKECEKVFEELKKNFGDNCWIEIGSGYYYWWKVKISFAAWSITNYCEKLFDF
jgi:hypothetical protein